MSEIKFKTLGIVGAGTMGSGIARLAALAKIDVLLYDINETILRRSLEIIKSSFRRAINAGTLTPEDSLAVTDRLRTRTGISDLAHCDIIIEAASEDLRVKKDLFKHLDADTRNTAILASATSSLSITSIAAQTKNPERVAGVHFFHPVDATALVEIVQGHKTSAATLDQVKEFVKLLGKTSIIVKDTPGFIAGRVSHHFYGEALQLLEERVATADQIDRIVKSVGGFTEGPFEALDRMGVDEFHTVSESLYNQSFHEPRFRPHALVKRMVESGLLGKKSGKGFFNYENE
jgi:3-hydroxybutyryl-CoA dehydrogenase